MAATTPPIVIIGSGMAGYAVAREFRKQNNEAPLLMITQDDGTSYSKPMLSTGFTKGKTADELAMATAAQMSEQLNMSVRTQTVVEGIDADQKTLRVDGQTLHFDKLVLATGASVNQAPFLDADASKICSINDLDDYRKFRALCSGKKRIAIIGTGLIGCEYANDLLNGEFEVALIGPGEQLFDNLLPKDAAECVTSALVNEGAELHLGRMVKAIEETETGVNVTLDDGNVIEADAVISAIGLHPNTTLAANAGITCNRGIVCDRYLNTSAKDIYTLGDCAEVDGHVLLYVLPMMASARALAKTLNGEPTEVSYGVMPVAIKTPCCPIVTSPPLSSEGAWTSESDGHSCKSLFHSYEGELLGFALTGDATKEKQALAKQLKGIHA